MKNSEKITFDSFKGKNPAEQMLTYIFKVIMPKGGYNLRESQLELSKKILSSLMTGKTALCEAEVGTGKTHAYLIAALVYRSYLKYIHEKRNHKTEGNYRKPITIATASISLQKSIVEDYIPSISSMLVRYGIIDKPLEYVVRKGKEHYVCDMRLYNYISNITDKDRAILPILENIRDYHWRNIDLGNVPNLKKYTKSMISVPQTCSKVFCKRYGRCRYSVLKKYFDSDSIDIQITNLNYYLADAIKRSEKQTPLLQEPCAVIFDEAHLLVDAARTMYGNSFQNTTVEKIAEFVQDLHITDSKLSISLYDQSENLKSYNEMLFSRLSSKALLNGNDEGTERFAISMTDATTRGYMKSIRRLLVKIRTSLHDEKLISERSIRKAKYIVKLSHLAEKQAEWLLSYPNLIYWLDYPRVSQKTNGQMAICGIPKNIPDLLYKNIWKSSVPKILTSGTLSIGGDFTHTKKMTGIEKLPNSKVFECTYESPFDYENNTVMYLSSSVPFPNYKDEEYIKGLADEIERLIKATHGHSLVLFTSYKVMELTYGLIKERISNIPIMMMSKGNLLGIKEFRKSKNGVLFATGSCWEGIDIPGDILSSLIIVKMPFPIPDPILEYEKSLYPTIREFKDHVAVPQMQIKIKQGCGRLIRRENDNGVICILDSRCRPGGTYHNDVMRAVHGGKKTTDIEEIKKFIKRVKSPEYFM